MKNYQDLLKKIIVQNSYKEDGQSLIDLRETRSGNTAGIFGHFMEWDLRKGFPAVTTKKLHLSTVIAELLMFLRGVSDRRIMQEYHYGIFNEDKWDIWKQDCERSASESPERFNGYNLGEMYPEYWRSLRITPTEIIPIKVREDLDKNYKESLKAEPVLVEGDHELLGQEFQNSYGHTYKVIEKVCSGTKKGNVKAKFLVQFHKTGFLKEATSQVIKKGAVLDIFQPTVAKVGYLGREKNKMTEHENRIYALWVNMINRCYNEKSSTYSSSGAKGITVSPRWHSFDNFLKDVFTLSGYQSWVEDYSGYSLDKDYFGSQVYSRNTCIFLESSLNSKIVGKPVVVGKKLYLTLPEALEAYNIKRQKDSKTSMTKLSSVSSEKVEYAKQEVGYNLRPKIFIDQIQDLIDTIKNDSASRRLVIDNWNPNYKEVSSLSACHNTFQVSVTEGGELDLMFNLRASDVFLGLPFNIASYAALAHILAKLSNTRVRYLKCSIGCAEIYEQHLEQCIEIINREPLPSPRLVMPEFTDLNSLLKCTAKDFRLRDYGHRGELKGKLTVGAEDE